MVSCVEKKGKRKGFLEAGKLFEISIFTVTAGGLTGSQNVEGSNF